MHIEGLALAVGGEVLQRQPRRLKTLHGPPADILGKPIRAVGLSPDWE
jgi:hypothetical protein